MAEYKLYLPPPYQTIMGLLDNIRAVRNIISHIPFDVGTIEARWEVATVVGGLEAIYAVHEAINNLPGYTGPPGSRRQPDRSSRARRAGQR